MVLRGRHTGGWDSSASPTPMRCLLTSKPIKVSSRVCVVEKGLGVVLKGLRVDMMGPRVNVG